MLILLGGSPGGVGIVDDDLFDLLPDLRPVNWHIDKQGYIRGRLAGKPVALHRVIGVRLMGCRPDQVTDHRFGDKLDSRRASLRVCAQRDNAKNVPMKKNNTSGVIGVSWDKTREKWLAHIKVNRKFINLGLHDRIEDAAAARRAGEQQHFGEFAHQAKARLV